MKRRTITFGLCALGLLGACASNSDGPRGSDDQPETPPSTGPSASVATGDAAAIEILSSRAEAVTGGDALVAVNPPRGTAPGSLTVTVNAVDVTSTFEREPDGRLVALVTDLEPGENVVTAAFGPDAAELTLVNHPSTGPVFSGPHQPLLVCTTEQQGLGPPLDSDCSAQTVTSWRYRSTDGSVKPLDDPTDPPDDVATVDVRGSTVDAILRDEVGTINRSVYRITVLDPGASAEAWDDTGWNGRLVYAFGGGCGTSYGQGLPLGIDFDVELLAEGYAMATASFNTFQTSCNDVLSAETLMMVKEHFIEQYGLPAFTIGQGASGGAIQQLLIGQNYPGLLDGINAILPFPDAVSIAPNVGDCGLLERFYASDVGSDWTESQRTAVNGHLTAATCTMWNETFVPVGIPDRGCDAGIDPARVYDADDNPTGLRCTIWDINANIWPIHPDTGFADRPLDNVGVQYGLHALNTGAISVNQFLDLNESIGSLDHDGRRVRERAEARTATLEVAYGTGRIITGGGALDEIPIILTDLYTNAVGDIHDRQQAFAIRDRLTSADGTPPGNVAIWTLPEPSGATALDRIFGGLGSGAAAIHALDEWLTAAAGVIDGEPIVDSLVRARPGSADDSCTTTTLDVFTGPDTHDPGSVCETLFPIMQDPRQIAGALRSNDVLKCRTQTIEAALDQGLYAVTLTDDHLARLDEVFPAGVCDFGQPGIGQVPLGGTWLSYGS